jgi:hypothetical protein
MKRNSKLTILTFLIIVVIFIWIPKGKKPAAVSANTSEQTMPLVSTAAKRRSEFVDWSRNPFVWPQQQEETGKISNLKVFAIICENEKSEAMIDESVVRVGDKIAGKTVKQIESDRVVLTDGTKDYILKFQD